MNSKSVLQSYLPSIAAAIEEGGTPEQIMKRVVARLYAQIDYYDWVGFYLMDGDELVGIITESDIFRALVYLEKNREGNVKVK